MNPLVFDVESTGVDFEVDQIIEAAYLEIPATPAEFLATPNANAFPSYCERFKPSVAISLGAQATHHILHSDLGQCRDSAEFKLPKTNYLIGHKIDFDREIAKAMKIPGICTLALSRFLFPDKDSHTQSAMLYLIGRRSGKEARIRDMLKNAHAALDDVRNCSVLLRFLLKEAATQGHAVDTWAQIHALSETARIPKIMGFGKHKGVLIQRGQLDAGWVGWYRKQAETDPYYIAAFKKAGF